MLAILVALTTGCQNDNDTSAPAARDTLFSLNVESNLQDINSITGLWESNKIDSSSQGDYEYVLRIKFDSNNATKAVKCTRKSTGAMAVVQHTVPYKIENGKLLFLENKETEYSENGIDCSLTSEKLDSAFAPSFKIENGLATLRNFVGGTSLVIRKIGN